MAKKPKKNIPRKSRKNTKLPSQALDVKDKVDYFKMKPVFKFFSADPNKWTLNKWKSKELGDLINTFKKMEQLSWNQIAQHNGLRMKKINNVSLPRHISPEEVLREIRICKVKRIFGFIDKNIFNIIWFDRDHSVCPEGKQRRYG